MAALHKPAVLLRRAIGPAIALIIIAYFLGAAVTGDNGVLSWGDYRRQQAERTEQLSQLKAEEARLAHRARLLDPRAIDPDLAEEMTRRDLGVVRNDEVIVQLED